jgi:hypothetical protein
VGEELSAPSNTERLWYVGYFDCTFQIIWMGPSGSFNISVDVDDSSRGNNITPCLLKYKIFQLFYVLLPPIGNNYQILSTNFILN